VCDLHHGLANGVCIVPAMEFNRDVSSERLTDLARMVGAVEQSASGFIDWLSRLQLQVGIPNRLSPLGVKPEHIPELVRIAVADGCHPSNPRPVTPADFEKLFQGLLA
jgi:alcohol dehydrogenase class IV